jgi:hypothetical protein
VAVDRRLPDLGPPRALGQVLAVDELGVVRDQQRVVRPVAVVELEPRARKSCA